jgi:hypothetical protein
MPAASYLTVAKGLSGIVLASVCCTLSLDAQRAGTASPGRSALAIAAPESAARVQRYGKFEVVFNVSGTSATAPQWPYDAAPPKGIQPGEGISVDGVFTDPSGRVYSQPAFLYQRFEDDVRNNRDWHYPTTDFSWRVRFSPHVVGTWKYKIVAKDRSGSTETEWRTFSVEPSASHGFVRVSRADSRYFEFDDGTFFTGLGFQFPEYFEDPVTRGGPAYRQLSSYGVNFARLWVSSLYGSAWMPWIGGRNRYAGYLPVAGLTPFRDESGQTTLTTQMDYEPAGDTGWFDACRLEASFDQESVKPNTAYQVRATYRGRRIGGPRNPKSASYGFVVKLGGLFNNCYEPGTSRVVTTYGHNNEEWGQVSGVWNSGMRSYLPKVHLALENVTQGAVFVRSVSIRELHPDGSEGPEILKRPSMEYQLDIPQARAYSLDTIVELAEKNGVYLKLVVMEKGDEIYLKTEDDGQFVTARDNEDGFYGVGRTVNKTRWLQQAWWRYLQARWGYSTNVHSWELVNEGDPASVRHFELADEFGKFMHYRAFGAEPGAAFDHPNDHLVTTSFWHSFPAAEFWANPAYPNVDYADVHAYISTSQAPSADKERMQRDEAFYHLWQSQAAAAARIGKPIVRGEAGMDVPGSQNEMVLGIQRDRTGTWLHNFLWSGLDSGGLYELYWWRSHIWNKEVDHRDEYRQFGRFLSGLDLNKGGYADWKGTVSNPSIRVVGQKNLKAGTMHLWIQNTAHTWKNVVDRRPIERVEGHVRVPGFRPGARYEVQWWDTHADENVAPVTESLVADASGEVVLAVTSLEQDVAMKLRPAQSSKPANLH